MKFKILLGLLFSLSIAFGTSLVVQQAHKYYVKDQTTANKVSIESPALAASYAIKLPVDDGTAGQSLQTDGVGNLSWSTISTGANQSLSNLTSPTSINQDLIPSGTKSLGNATDKWNAGHFLSNILYGSISGNITLQAANTTTNYSLKFPPAQGAATQTLINDGAGNLSWGAGGGGSPGGASGNVQFNNAGVFDGSNNLHWDNINFRLGINELTPTDKLNVSGSGNSVIKVNSDTLAASSSIEIGEGSTGYRSAHIDLTGDDTYTDFGLRIIRNNSGPNAASSILHRGTGNLNIVPINLGSFVVWKDNGANQSFDNAGNSLRVHRQDAAAEGGQLELLAAGGVGSTINQTIDNYADQLRLGSFSGYGSVRVLINGSERFVVDSTSRIYASAIHNNASGCGGATPMICSGTFAPALTSCILATGSGKYTRVGNIVSYTLLVASATAGVNCSMNLPIASNLTALNDCTGTVSSNGGSSLLQALTGTDQCTFSPPVTGSYGVSGQYIVQ